MLLWVIPTAFTLRSPSMENPWRSNAVVSVIERFMIEPDEARKSTVPVNVLLVSARIMLEPTSTVKVEVPETISVPVIWVISTLRKKTRCFLKKATWKKRCTS